MKKIIYILILLVSFNITNVFASTKTFERTKENNYLVKENLIREDNLNNILSTPAVDSSEKIYDFAELLNEEEESKIFLELSNYIKLNNLDFVVVTTNSHSKLNTKDYANDFYDYNDFGKNDTFDGLIFVIDMDKREFYLSTSGKCIDMFTDSRIDSILDYCYNDIENGNYGEGVIKVIKRINYFTSIGTPDVSDNKSKVTGVSKLKTILYGPSFMGSIIITIIIVAIIVFQHRNVHEATSSKQFIKNSNVTVTKDIFLNRSVSKMRRAQESSSSSSRSYRSSSSRSSISHSSSGRSHGGGGRHF